jgi:hypothetical protein
MNKDVIESLSQTLIFTLTCYQHSLANRREREREINRVHPHITKEERIQKG